MTFIANLIKLIVAAAVLYFTIGAGALAWHLYGQAEQAELDRLEAKYDPAPAPKVSEYRKALLFASIAMCHERHKGSDAAYDACRSRPDSEDVEVISKWCAKSKHHRCEFLR